MQKTLSLFYICWICLFNFTAPYKKKLGDEWAMLLGSTKGCHNWLKGMTKSKLQIHLREIKLTMLLAVFSLQENLFTTLTWCKVGVFHGYPVGRRGEKRIKNLNDLHFTIKRIGFDDLLYSGWKFTSTFEESFAKTWFFLSVVKQAGCRGWPVFHPWSRPISMVKNTNRTSIILLTFSKGV